MAAPANLGIHNAPTIHIQEPRGRTTTADDLQSPPVAHGIYAMRNHTNSFTLDRSRTRSFSRTSTIRRQNTEWDAEAGIMQEGDFKEKQVGRATDSTMFYGLSRAGLSWENAVLV